jgi:ligand-binding sensor protein
MQQTTIRVGAPVEDDGEMDLAHILDVPAIQSLMDDFFSLTQIGVAILDIKGTVLVATGWQDICTQFHRVHPETARHCLESDTRLSKGVEPGTFKLYRCKNQMWDMATPIIVGGQHVGNLFLGQFFFSDEEPDYPLFRAQARKYGFDENEYAAALRKIRPDIPVILASGYDEASVMTGEHAEWPQVFMGKPYSLEDLGQAIGRVIDSESGI